MNIDLPLIASLILTVLAIATFVITALRNKGKDVKESTQIATRIETKMEAYNNSTANDIKEIKIDVKEIKAHGSSQETRLTVAENDIENIKVAQTQLDRRVNKLESDK